MALNTFYVLLKLASRAHNLMAAAQAAELEISAYTQHLPALFAAGVLFFHCQNIADLNVHYFLISSQYFFAACSFLLSPYS